MAPHLKQLLHSDSETLDLPGPACNPSELALLDFHTLAQLAGATLFGCLARIGIVALFTGSNQSAFPVIWAQALGCWLFGLVVHRREDIIAYSPQLYVAARVGFAGSIATFASWENQSFQAVSGFKAPERLWLHNATDFISQVLVTLAVAFFSMHFGAHLHSHFPFRPTRHAIHRRTQWILSAVSLLLWLTVLLTFVLSPYDWRTGRRVSLSLVVAPPATWIRWWLAAYLNPRSPEWIKWGTFASNMLSTSILATSVLLQFTLPTAKSILLQCQALQSLQDGFSGCLSTIPAFLEHAEVMDRRETRRWYAWTYIAGMYLGGLLCVVLILGVGWWTTRFEVDAQCVY